MPGNQYNAIGDRDLDFFDAIQAGFHRRDSSWIGKIHEPAIAEIGCRANCGVDRDKPENERHNLLLHPQGSILLHNSSLGPLAPTLPSISPGYYAITPDTEISLEKQMTR